MGKFKVGEARLLVATDVMGRGLDIPTITHVVIFDMGELEDYVHRIGRTARGLSVKHGKGHALTLFEYNEKYSHLAAGLVKVLEESENVVPPELRKIAEEVENGTRAWSERVPGNKKFKKKGGNWQQDDSWGDGNSWNEEASWGGAKSNGSWSSDGGQRWGGNGMGQM